MQLGALLQSMNSPPPPPAHGLSNIDPKVFARWQLVELALLHVIGPSNIDTMPRAEVVLSDTFQHNARHRCPWCKRPRHSQTCPLNLGPLLPLGLGRPLRTVWQVFRQGLAELAHTNYSDIQHGHPSGSKTYFVCCRKRDLSSVIGTVVRIATSKQISNLI